MNTITQNINELVERYEKDMRYDPHQTETKISRSKARLALREIGNSAFLAIAEKMKVIFFIRPIDYDMLMAYVWLITDIIKKHKLPKAPYSPKVKYGDQDPQEWIKYCERNK